MAAYQVNLLEFSTPCKRTLQGGNYYNIFLIHRGRGMFRRDSESRACGSEDIVIMKPGLSLTLEYAGGRYPLQMLWVQVNAELLHRLSDERNDLEKSFNVVPFRWATVHTSSSSAMLMRNLANRLRTVHEESAEFANDIFRDGLLSLLLVLVLRAGMQAEFGIHAAQRTHFMVDDVFVYLRDHLSENITLKALSNRFYVSPEHIARVFKKQTGQSVHAYLVKERLGAACAALLTGEKVEDVCRFTGFQSYSGFVQAFRRVYGTTPTAYRKNSRSLPSPQK